MKTRYRVDGRDGGAGRSSALVRLAASPCSCLYSVGARPASAGATTWQASRREKMDGGDVRLCSLMFGFLGKKCRRGAERTRLPSVASAHRESADFRFGISDLKGELRVGSTKVSMISLISTQFQGEDEWSRRGFTIIYDNYDNSTNITSFFKHLFDGMDGFDGAKTRIVRCRVYESYDNNESYMRKILTGWTG